jgi:hypothetical protein
MKNTLIRITLATAGLATAGLAYATMHPLRLTVEPLALEQAQLLLAAAISAPQDPTAASGAQLPPRTVIEDVDNVHGLRFHIRELADRYVAILTPFSPDPQYASHMTAPVLPAHALVRHESGIYVTDYLMTQVGSSWVASIAKSSLSLFPTDFIYAGVWAPGASYPDPTAAAYWHFWRM